MKLNRTITLGTLLLAAAGWSASAVAGDTNAFCQLVSHGDKVHKGTGHCQYENNGDQVYIKLANGDSYTLTRKEKKNKFKDQKGKNVNRTMREKEGSHYYKWEHKNITVFPEGKS